MLSTGFPTWNLRDYQNFCRAFRKGVPTDELALYEQEMGGSKTVEEIEEYMSVFLLRYTELKDRDLHSKLFQEKDFQKLTEMTLENYDPNKFYTLLI